MVDACHPTVGARELKIRLGTYLRRVREGESLVVTERGRPIAELRPLPGPEAGVDAKLVSLAAAGLISWDPGRPGLPNARRPLPGRSRSLSRALEEERGDRI